MQTSLLFLNNDVNIMIALKRHILMTNIIYNEFRRFEMLQELARYKTGHKNSYVIDRFIFLVSVEL